MSNLRGDLKINSLTFDFHLLHIGLDIFLNMELGNFIHSLFNKFNKVCFPSLVFLFHRHSSSSKDIEIDWSFTKFSNVPRMTINRTESIHSKHPANNTLLESILPSLISSYTVSFVIQQLFPNSSKLPKGQAPRIFISLRLHHSTEQSWPLITSRLIIQNSCCLWTEDLVT